MFVADVVLYNSSLLISIWYLCWLSERCQNAGQAVARALHTPSNYHDTHYQRFIRIFSIQMKELPIRIRMKQLFTFNYSLLKSVIYWFYFISWLNLCSNITISRYKYYKITSFFIDWKRFIIVFRQSF